MFVFRKIWRALFFWNTRFEIRPFAFLLTCSSRATFRGIYIDLTMISLPCYRHLQDKVKQDKKFMLLFFSIRQFYILLELVTSNVTIAMFQLSVNCISKVSEFWIRNILQWVLRLNLKKHQITNSYDKTLDFKEGENIIRSI